MANNEESSHSSRSESSSSSSSSQASEGMSLITYICLDSKMEEDEEKLVLPAGTVTRSGAGAVSTRLNPLEMAKVKKPNGV